MDHYSGFRVMRVDGRSQFGSGAFLFGLFLGSFLLVPGVCMFILDELQHVTFVLVFYEIEVLLQRETALLNKRRGAWLI